MSDPILTLQSTVVNFFSVCVFYFSGATSLKDAIEPLQQEGVTTFIFRIGFEPDLKELVPVVDSPENIFTFARFADMDARVPYVARQIPFNSGM